MTDIRAVIPEPDALDDWAAEYVLGTLPAAERERLEARLAQDPALRRAVRDWEARLQPLTALAAPVEPTAALWPRIAAAIAGSRLQTTPVQAATAPATETALRPLRNRAGFGRWPQRGGWRWLAGAGVALAVFFAAVLVVLQGAGPTSPSYLAVLVPPQGEAPGWIVQSRAGGRLSLAPLAPMAAVPADKSLQFWTKADSWSGPVSLGLVQVNQRLEVAIDQLPPLQPNQLFELTLEPAAGSPLNRPTGPILYIGRAVELL